MNDSDRRQLRTRMRRARRAIIPEDRAPAVETINRKLVAMTEFRDAGCIAVYSAFDGEPDIAPVMNIALEMGKDVCLPVLPQQADKPLTFAPLAAGGRWRNNRMGIAEPIVANDDRVPPDLLDLVLVPLVAFDSRGNRLGMGAGYYDRTFAFMQATGTRKPRLVGVAFEQQKHNALDPRPWDVPLWSIVTEKQCYRSEATEN